MGNTETSLKDREELSIQIYEIVHKIYPKHSEKITGMILESKPEELSFLLNGNHEELMSRIKTAATIVQDPNEIENESHKTLPDSIDDIDLIGNKIYGIVQQLYPVFAGNVTGMLLEMDINRLRELLHDKNELIKCIHQAAHVYMENQAEKNSLSTDNIPPSSKQSKTDVIETHSAKIEQDIQTLGEQVYLKIVPKYPTEAAKLTGMFMEMDIENLKETLENSELFATTLTDALEVLQNVEQKSLNGILNDSIDIKEMNRYRASDIEINTSACSIENSIVDQERHDLAEQLYLKVAAKYPSEAPKIMGMFLEMDLGCLKELNENSELFNKKVDESLQALRKLKNENDKNIQYVDG